MIGLPARVVCAPANAGGRSRCRGYALIHCRARACRFTHGRMPNAGQPL